MLVATCAVLAIRCTECGKMEFHAFSRFAFPKGGTVYFKCSCGASKLTAGTKNHAVYWLQVPCMVCETKHQWEIPGKSLWSGEVTVLACQDTGLELGHIGPERRVREMVSNNERELEAIIDEFGCDGYFHNPEIMYGVLRCLHKISGQGALYCQCGNYKIEVDIFPDRLELHCRNCDSINIIYAETEEDLKVIQQVESIELTQSGFKCLDSLSSTGKLKKAPPKKKNS